MKTMIERFRRWYEHERDSNAKCLAMLASVPEEKRSQPFYQKAIDKMAHLVAARHRWLFRLGVLSTQPEIFPKETKLSDLPALVESVEHAWVNYLNTLDDAKLAQKFEYNTPDGKRMRWDLESLLTQTNGHAWYHRGQIAMLVAELGGKAVDTDYIFFQRPEAV
jgi:uncharacterized damage-inducible protein DinB